MTDDATDNHGRKTNGGDSRGSERASTAACGRAQEASDRAAEGGPLGNYSELVLAQGDEEAPTYADLSRIDRRRVRFGARAMLWNASSLKPVRCCGRLIRGDGPNQQGYGGVTVKLSRGAGSSVAGFGNLATCGSVWACPRCAAVVASRRSLEIGNAVREALRLGGSVYMLTLTMRHSDKDQLPDLWDSLSNGWRAVFGDESWTGRESRVTQRGTFRPAVTGDAERFNVAGVSRTVECTNGLAGWHLHAHALVFCVGSSFEEALAPGWEAQLSGLLGHSALPSGHWISKVLFSARVAGRWSKGLKRRGFDCGPAGVDVREVLDDGADYIGSYLAKSTYDAASKVAIENANGMITKSGRQRNQTPFELLYDLSEQVSMQSWGIRTPRHWKVVADEHDYLVVDTDTHEVKVVAPPGRWRLWWEWEQGSRRRRQLVWSHRRPAEGNPREVRWNQILDARGREPDRDDQELARKDLGGTVLGEILRSAWYRQLCYRPSWLTTILELAESNDTESLQAWLSDHGIDFEDSTTT